jgi:hypothetical protein
LMVRYPRSMHSDWTSEATRVRETCRGDA